MSRPAGSRHWPDSRSEGYGSPSRRPYRRRGICRFGVTKDFIVARFHPDLSLDTSFNGTGYVTQNFDTQDEAYGVAIQTDGKILVVGYAENFNATRRYLALARYLPDGTLDTSFNAPFGLIMWDLFGEAETNSRSSARLPCNRTEDRRGRLPHRR